MEHDSVKTVTVEISRDELAVIALGLTHIPEGVLIEGTLVHVRDLPEAESIVEKLENVAAEFLAEEE